MLPKRLNGRCRCGPDDPGTDRRKRCNSASSIRTTAEFSSLGEQYENRLQLIEVYDRLGFRSYHMSEHHATPLNVAPSPSVFLAAVAQRTKRICFGALGVCAARASPAAARRGNLHVGSPQRRPARGSASVVVPLPPRRNCSISASIRQQAGHECRGTHQVIMQALTPGSCRLSSGRHYRFRPRADRSQAPCSCRIRRCGTRCRCLTARRGRRRTRSTSSAAGPVVRVREITDRYRAEWAAVGNASGGDPADRAQPFRRRRRHRSLRRWRSGVAPGPPSSRGS